MGCVPHRGLGMPRSRWCRIRGACVTVVAGVPGFEPGNAGVKVPCLTAWLHPKVDRGASLPTAPPVGSRNRAAASDSSLAPPTLAMEGVPSLRFRRRVRGCSTAQRPSRRCRSFALGRAARASRSLRPLPGGVASPPPRSHCEWRRAGVRHPTGVSGVSDPPPSRALILILGVFRVNAGAWNTAAVETGKGSRISTYQGRSRVRGTRRSPTPSAHAARPRTNTGTSAPIFTASSASLSASIPRCQSRLSPTSVDAASLLPPPRTAAERNPLLDRDVRPFFDPGCVTQNPRRPDDEVVRLVHAGNRGSPTHHGVVAARDVYPVREVDELKDGLKLVIAVRSSPDDVQEQIELGRRGGLDHVIDPSPAPGPAAVHTGSLSAFHLRITIVASTVSLVNRMRSGRARSSRSPYRS